MGTIFLDTEALVGVLRELLEARAEEEGIVAAWLFGSVARGTARPDSDVDVGILYREDRALSPPLPRTDRQTLMIDTDLVHKKLALIESCVHELRTLGRPAEIRSDVRELRFAAYEAIRSKLKSA